MSLLPVQLSKPFSIQQSICCFGYVSSVTRGAEKQELHFKWGTNEQSVCIYTVSTCVNVCALKPVSAVTASQW